MYLIIKLLQETLTYDPCYLFSLVVLVDYLKVLSILDILETT
jgi:hypothetical protein